MHFFLQVLESIISEKTNLLEKHPKKDIGQVEKVSVVRDIKSFMEVKDFCKMKKTFVIFMFDMLLYFAEIFRKSGQKL